MNPLTLTLLLLGQLQPGDLQHEAQKVITNRQSNANEKHLQQQVNLHTAKVRLQILQALAPGAGETVQIPISGTGVDSKGNPVSISGTVTVTFESGSTPTPIPPIGTVLTGVRSTQTGQLVTTAPSGTRLLLEGQNLVQEGTVYIVTIGGERAEVLRGIDTVIEFRAPIVPVGKPPLLILYWLVNNNWLEKGRLPFEVSNTAPTPIPPEPPIPVPPDPNPPLQGENPRFDSISPSGGRVVLTGAGFGATRGRVLLDNLPLQVVAWSEARIECLGPANTGNNVVVALWRPAYGWHSEAWSPLPSGRK